MYTAKTWLAPSVQQHLSSSWHLSVDLCEANMVNKGYKGPPVQCPSGTSVQSWLHLLCTAWRLLQSFSALFPSMGTRAVPCGLNWLHSCCLAGETELETTPTCCLSFCTWQHLPAGSHQGGISLPCHFLIAHESSSVKFKTMSNSAMQQKLQLRIQLSGTLSKVWYLWLIYCQNNFSFKQHLISKGFHLFLRTVAYGFLFIWLGKTQVVEHSGLTSMWKCTGRGIPQ